MLEIHTKLEFIDTGKWNQLLDNSKFSNYFQSPEYINFVSRAGFKPFVFAAEENSIYKYLLAGVIQSNLGFIGKFITARAIVYGGILIKDGLSENTDLHIFLDNIAGTLKREAIYLEFRNLHSYSDYKDTFIKAGFSFKSHYNFKVHLGDEKIVKARMNSGKLRQVKRSVAEGAVIKKAESIDEVRAFYNILEEAYKKRIRLPLPGWNFFENFFQSGQGVYLLIIYNKNIIGGIMCPLWKNQVIYEWYISGEDKKYEKIYPSVLATWAAMDYGLKNKFIEFDFMGAGSSTTNVGVRKFKEGFGGTLVDHGRFIMVYHKRIYKYAETILGLLRR